MKEERGKDCEVDRIREKGEAFWGIQWVGACLRRQQSITRLHRNAHTGNASVRESADTQSHAEQFGFLVPGEVRAILKQGGSEKGRKGSLRAWGCLQPTRFLGLALSPLGSMESRR